MQHLPDIVAWACFLTGLAGVLLPLLPGLWLIVLGGWLYQWLAPGHQVSWWTIAAMTLLAVIGVLLEVFAGSAGARWFGGSKWGGWGALIGGLIGLFFGIPGLLIGPIAGAILAELIFAKRHIKDATKAGIGTVVGIAGSTFAKLGLGILMVLLFAGDRYLW